MIGENPQLHLPSKRAPQNFSPYPIYQARVFIQESERRYEFWLRCTIRTLNGVIAVAGQNTVQNGWIGSCISVAAQFLGIQYGYGPFNLIPCSWLLFPYTV